MYGLLNESVSNSQCVGRNKYIEVFSAETSRKWPLGRTGFAWQGNSGMNLRVVEQGALTGLIWLRITKRDTVFSIRQ
jgi:hypothetical protein